MHMPSPCSTGSAPSRVEWRPSRLQGAAQLLVLAAAPWLIGASAVPAPLHLPLLLLCWLAGALHCWQGQRRPRRVLWLTAPDRPLLLDGQELQQVRLRTHGPWLQLHWQGERSRGQLLFWPDTLQRRQRRELRLAVATRAVTQQVPTVAP